MSGISIAKSLELHLLQPLITGAELHAGIERAAAEHLAAVCVWPVHVEAAARELRGSDTRVRAAISFPFGQETPQIKLAACDRALLDGADELVVMLDHTSLGAGGDPLAVRGELDRLLEHAWWSSLNAARGRAELTVALETTMLELDQLEPILRRLQETTAGFVQTGSGHQPRAVTQQHVRTLREHLPPDIAIVAVGGVATLSDARSLVAAGATRVGSGSAGSIVAQERRERDARVRADAS